MLTLKPAEEPVRPLLHVCNTVGGLNTWEETYENLRLHSQASSQAQSSRVGGFL